MAKKGRTTSQNPNKKEKSFIGQVSILHGDRLHIEIPKKRRDDFEPGDSVRVEEVEYSK